MLKTVRLTVLVLAFVLPSLATAEWVALDIGGSSNNMIGVCVGPGRNDGVNRVYGSSNDYKVWEFSWDGSSWIQTEVGTSNGVGMTAVAVGTGRNDDTMRVYATDYGYYAGNLWEFTWTGSSWHRYFIGTCPRELSDATLGNGRNDGVLRVYVTCLDGHVYEYTWTGAVWSRVDVGFGAGGNMTVVRVGKGRNDGTNRVYAGHTSNYIFEFTWSGSAWETQVVGTGNSGYMSALAVGAGRNDGTNRVYGGDWGYRAYEFTWTGNEWVRDTVGLRGRGDMKTLIIGPGRNDGVNRVYGATRTWGYVYEFSYEGSTWETETIWDGPDAIELALGDGRNDGVLRLYEAGFDRRMYEISYLTGIEEPNRGVTREGARPTIARGTLLLPHGFRTRLLDVRGSTVARLEPGVNDIRHVAPGVYFIRGEDADPCRRVVVIR